MLRPYSTIFMCAITLHSSAQASLSGHAVYVAVYNGYELVLRDKRRLMAHDIGALMHNTYIVESHIWVPSLTGTVDAKDVHVYEVETMHDGSRQCDIRIASGTVTLQNSKLTVDLQQTRCPKPACTSPYGFNGDYHLHKSHTD